MNDWPEPQGIKYSVCERENIAMHKEAYEEMCKMTYGKYGYSGNKYFNGKLLLDIPDNCSSMMRDSYNKVNDMRCSARG